MDAFLSFLCRPMRINSYPFVCKCARFSCAPTSAFCKHAHFRAGKEAVGKHAVMGVRLSVQVLDPREPGDLAEVHGATAAPCHSARTLVELSEAVGNDKIKHKFVEF